MIEDSKHSGDTTDVGKAIKRWNRRYNVNYDIVNDPTSGRRLSIAPSRGGSIGLPYTIVVNPRDMKVIKTFQGDRPDIKATVDQLIKDNSSVGAL